MSELTVCFVCFPFPPYSMHSDLHDQDARSYRVESADILAIDVYFGVCYVSSSLNLYIQLNHLSKFLKWMPFLQTPFRVIISWRIGTEA